MRTIVTLIVIQKRLAKGTQKPLQPAGGRHAWGSIAKWLRRIGGPWGLGVSSQTSAVQPGPEGRKGARAGVGGRAQGENVVCVRTCAREAGSSGQKSEPGAYVPGSET